jgi:hypothetical protein
LRFLAGSVAAFTAPGVVPKNYEPGEILRISAGNLESTRTNFPLEFYFLPWCGEDELSEVTGVSYKGNTLVDSPYEYEFNNLNSYKALCSKTFDEEGLNNLRFSIMHHYHYKLHLDGLPSATVVRSKDGKEVLDYFEGIPVGLHE